MLRLHLMRDVDDLRSGGERSSSSSVALASPARPAGRRCRRADRRRRCRCARSASRSAFTYISVGLGTAASSRERRGADRDLPAHVSIIDPGIALERDLALGAPAGAVMTPWSMVSPLPAGDVLMIGAPAGLLARADQQLDLVLVVLQRADRRAVAERDVVPRPARGPSRARQTRCRRRSAGRLISCTPFAASCLAHSSNTAHRSGCRGLIVGSPFDDHHEVAVDACRPPTSARWRRAASCSGSPSPAARPRRRW